MSSPERLLVLLYSGIFVHYDAISDAVQAKWEVLDDLRRQGLPIDVRIVTHGSNRDNPDVLCVRSPADVLVLPCFAQATVHLFEFGVYYSLFDVVFAKPSDAIALATYHNITPEALVHPADRRTLRRSLRQRDNLALCSSVAVVSELNRQDLLEAGFDAPMLEHVPLPAAGRFRACRAQRHWNRPFTYLYVGRLTQAKGIADLLRAAAEFTAQRRGSSRVVLAGNLDFAEPNVVSAVREARAEGIVELHVRPTHAHLARLYGEADAYVTASHHEGFCVPIIEALDAGCQVLAAASGNIPNVVQDLGVLVPAHEPSPLADAMVEMSALRPGQVLSGRGVEAREPWLGRVDRHVEQFSPLAFRTTFLDWLGRALAREGRRPAWWPGVD